MRRARHVRPQGSASCILVAVTRDETIYKACKRVYDACELLHGDSIDVHSFAAIRAQHLLCDAVVFLGRPEDCVRMFSQWRGVCEQALAADAQAPCAFLALPPGFAAVQQHLITQTTSKSFSDVCLDAQISSSESYDPACVREKLKSSWYTQHLSRYPDLRSKIKDAYIEHIGKQNGHLFSISSALLHHLVGAVQKLSVKPLVEDWRQEHEDSMVSSVAAYLMLDTARTISQSRTLTHKLITQLLLADLKKCMYHERYEMLSAFEGGPKGVSAQHRCRLIEATYRQWEIFMDEYRLTSSESCHSLFQRHIGRVQRNRAFLQTRKFGLKCALCIRSRFNWLLACSEHGICRSCTIERDTEWHINGYIKETDCPICEISNADLKIPLWPPRARCRILTLDGGGVKGLVQLEALRYLQEIIDVSLPIDVFFDLVVGTSIGGILALGLFHKRWSLDECQGLLTTLSMKVFTQQTKLEAGLSMLSRGWSRHVTNLYRVATGRSIYNNELLEKILQEAFGSDKMLLASRNSTSVAVTTTTTAKPACRLLTSYPSTSGANNEVYSYLGESALRAQKVSEAARCTSAAPFYFNPKTTTDGEMVYDGGCVYNDPSSLASHEAGQLWDCPPDENLLVSVGCGIAAPSMTQDNHLTRVWKSYSHGMDSYQQKAAQRLNGHTPPSSHLRLDPHLGCDYIQLDGIANMLQELPAIRERMRADPDFRNRVRAVAIQCLASTFYCHLSEQNEPNFYLCSRLGQDVKAVWQRYPQAHFLLNGKRVSVQGYLPMAIDLARLRANADGGDRAIDMVLVIEDRSASISGFPTTLATFTTGPRRSAPIVLGKHKLA